MNCIRSFFKIYFSPTLYFVYNTYYYAVAPDVEKQMTIQYTVECNVQFVYNRRKIRLRKKIIQRMGGGPLHPYGYATDVKYVDLYINDKLDKTKSPAG